MDLNEKTFTKVVQKAHDFIKLYLNRQLYELVDRDDQTSTRRRRRRKSPTKGEGSKEVRHYFAKSEIKAALREQKARAAN